ncbi:Hpt domain-containing protein [Butyrivibrio sp. AE3004]|uniref:Hpt domain-containing protein n=1 Tax=Butyrivibrio sp. AE3004 TaxID=1506994 RepID=UPI000B090FA5|nr:Hpt domain-containing protein [Butyrivibrio sp. AE3004]
MNISGISVADGLNFCGSKKAFLKFLNTFYNSIENKAAEIEDAYNDGNLGFYTTKVHSLKSTARIIGAFELSEMALMLEEAGRSGDVKCIEDNTARLLELYKSYRDRLSVLDKINEDDDCAQKEISPEYLEDAYNALKEIIPSMDYDAAEMVLDELKAYKLPADDKEKIKRLSMLLKKLKWDEMENILKNH